MAYRRRRFRPIRRRRRGRRVIRHRRVRRSRFRRRVGGSQFSQRFIRVLNFDLAHGEAKGLAIAFKLDDFTDTRMWDYYRINAAVVKVQPRNNIGNPMIDNYGAVCYSIIDFDDNNIPKSHNEFLNHTTLRMFRTGSVHVRKVKPRPLTYVFANSTTPQQAGLTLPPRRTMWINMSAPGVPHYGIKMWFDNSKATKAISYEVIYKLYVTLKSPLFTGKNVAYSSQPTLGSSTTYKKYKIEDIRNQSTVQCNNNQTECT